MIPMQAALPLAEGANLSLIHIYGQIRREMCEPVCSPEQLSEGRCVTSIAGVVTEEAARETGLNAGTPVITGTGDSAAEAISVGVVAPGELMVQFGSSVFFYCCTDHMVVDDRVRGNTFLIPDTFSIAAGTNNGGTVQKWYLDPVSYTHLDVYKRQTR